MARAKISHSAAFISVAIMFIIFAAASAVPTPLYVVYQEAWDFSSTALTFVFAIYVVGLLGSLLTFGALSDHIGRRPVLGAAVALQSVALVFFIAATNIEVLTIARFLQGVATGAAFTTLGAALVDLNPPHAPGRAGMISGIAPLGGLALGAVGCGALVQYAPAPTELVFVILLASMVLAAVIIAVMPETSSLTPGARKSLRPRVGIPEGLNRQVYALIPIMAASWSLGGLYLSLGPSVTASVFGMESHLVGGLMVTLLCGTGAITAFMLRDWTTDRLLNFAATLLLVGILATLAGLVVEIALVAAIGTLIAGIGVGASSLGTFGTYAPTSTPD